MEKYVTIEERHRTDMKRFDEFRNENLEILSRLIDMAKSINKTCLSGRINTIY